MSTSESKPYHHGDLRAALITQTIAMLDQGEADFSLREVARACGVSATAAYRHFADKDALLAAVADNGFALLDEQSAETASLKPMDRLLFDLIGYVEFAREKPALYSVMFGRLHSPNADMPKRSASFVGLREKVMAVSPGADDLDVLRVWASVHGVATLVIAGLIGPERQAAGAIKALLAPIAANPKMSETRPEKPHSAQPRIH
jgi:AcrR family transcriptional regulator